MRSRASGILVFALVAVGSSWAGAEHLVDPPVLTLGGRASYRIRTDGYASVAELAATTVHAPAAPGVEALPGARVWRSEAGRLVREDEFLLRPTRPGKLLLEPALVERPGRRPDPVAAMTLEVVAPASGTPRPGPFLLGFLLLVPAAALWQLRRARREAGLPAPPSGAPFDRGALLAPVREARLRGDVRGFFVALNAALRGAVRALTGRSPRDAGELAAQARVAGLPEPLVEPLRALTARCEQVTFASVRPDPSTLTEAWTTAERILAALEAPGTGSTEGSTSA